MIWIELSGAIVLAAILGFAISWTRVRIQKAKVKQLVRANKEMESYVKLLRENHEKEREFLSKRLHDDIGGELAALKLMVSSLSRNLHGSDFDLAMSMNRIIDGVISQARFLSSEMYPAALKLAGLNEALRGLCEQVNNPKIQSVSFSTTGDITRIPHAQEMVLYRSVKELINNAHKHSHAWHIWVETQWKDDRLTILVKDDGVGMRNWKVNNSGTGHRLIEGALMTINATIKVDPSPGNFSVLMEVPIVPLSDEEVR